MIELSGTIESNSLAPLLNFFAGLGQTGRLRLTRSRLAGDIDFRDGSVVEAVCGAERGIAALDLLVLLPGRAEFTFVVMQPATAARSLELAPDALRQRLDSLEEMQRHIAEAVPSLTARPRLIVQAGSSPADRFTVTRGEITLLLAVDGDRTVLDLIGTRDLLARLRALTDLVDQGFVEIVELGDAAAVQAQPVLEPATLALTARARRRWFPARQIGWAAIVVFVIVAGAAQLPDILRQFRGTVPPPALPAASLPAEPAAIWPTQPGSGFWTTPDGYHLAPSGSASELLVTPPLSTRSQDVAVRARFRKLNGADGASYGFAIRDMTDSPRVGTSSDGNYVLVALTDKHQVVARRRDGQRWLDLVAGSQISPPSQPDGQDAMSVRALGNRLEVEINGTEVATFVDPAPSSGGIAFYAGGQGAEILIDEFNLSFP